MIEIILSFLAGIIISWIKEFFQFQKFKKNITSGQKKQSKEIQEIKEEDERQNEKRQKWLTEKFQSLEIKLIDLTTMFYREKEDKIFQRKFKNDFKNHCRNILRLNSTLDHDFRDAFLYWCDLVEDYAMNFYQDMYRNSDEYDSKELEQNITDDMHSMIDKFRRYLNINKVGGANSNILFSEFCSRKGANIHSASMIFLGVLKQNGLVEYKAFKKEFIDYINHFFQNYTTAIKLWKGEKVES